MKFHVVFSINWSAALAIRKRIAHKQNVLKHQKEENAGNMMSKCHNIMAESIYQPLPQSPSFSDHLNNMGIKDNCWFRKKLSMTDILKYRSLWILYV